LFVATAYIPPRTQSPLAPHDSEFTVMTPPVLSPVTPVFEIS
jgi:hypothetical protein